MTPVHQETDYEFRSSWLLPVLREHVRNTELGFFTEYFLPLAAACLDRSVEERDESSVDTASTMQCCAC